MQSGEAPGRTQEKTTRRAGPGVAKPVDTSIPGGVSAAPPVALGDRYRRPWDQTLAPERNWHRPWNSPRLALVWCCGLGDPTCRRLNRQPSNPV